jgi:hypothetical protein
MERILSEAEEDSEAGLHGSDGTGFGSGSAAPGNSSQGGSTASGETSGESSHEGDDGADSAVVTEADRTPGSASGGRGAAPQYGEDNAWIREICEREEADPDLREALQKECAKYQKSGL